MYFPNGPRDLMKSGTHSEVSVSVSGLASPPLAQQQMTRWEVRMTSEGSRKVVSPLNGGKNIYLLCSRLGCDICAVRVSVLWQCCVFPYHESNYLIKRALQRFYRKHIIVSRVPLWKTYFSGKISLSVWQERKICKAKCQNLVIYCFS